MSKKTIQVVLGPTAVGKTNWAIEQAQKVGGAIVSADSRQIYAGMNIGTAKPEEAWSNNTHDILHPDVIRDVPHYLFNVASPNASWTLPQWQQAAQKVMAHLTQQDVPVFLVGGTMLYIDSILFNYDIPAVAPNPELRARLDQESVEVLYSRLLVADPAAKDFIEPHHKHRIIRALEVIEISGKPFSASRLRKEPPYTFTITGLFPEQAFSDKGWEVLRDRITKRISAMVNEGLQKETEHLITTYSASLPLLRTMNYIQMQQMISGETSRQAAEQEMVSVNMKYARRQMSWWRGREDIQWVSS